MVWCNILTDFVVILANTLDNYNCPSSVYFFINVNCNSCNFVVVSAIIKKQFICVLQNIFRYVDYILLLLFFCYFKCIEITQNDRISVLNMFYKSLCSQNFVFYLICIKFHSKFYIK